MAKIRAKAKTPKADGDELAALRAVQFHAEPLPAFQARISPKLAPLPRHLRRIAKLFEASRHREVRALIDMPPRHGKTEEFAHGLAWRTVYDPACLNFYVTFGEDLSRTTSRKVRHLVRVAGVPLAADMQQVTDWRTALGGGLKATSTGGSITGRGCNGGVIVADDTLKGREQAESKLYRDRLWDWFRADVMSRLEPGASLLVCNTRWHDDDLIGRLEKDPLGETWEKLSLPAIGDEHGNAIDERLEPDKARALWPQGGWDLQRLARIRARGEYDWWSLYQGQPRPKGGRLFEGEPARFELRDFKLVGKRAVIVCDPAATGKTSADYSAIQVWAMDGYGDAARAFLLYAWRGQVSIPELCRKLIDVQARYRLLVAVEAVAGFKAVPQMLREAAPGLRILEISPRGDKFTRAQAYSAAWKAGRVLVPVGELGVDEFITEHQAFTGLGDAHDDQVDCGAHGWNTLYREVPTDAQRREEPEF